MKILVIYFSQSGQLRHILDNVVQDIKQEATIDFAAIKPVTLFLFPDLGHLLPMQCPSVCCRYLPEIQPMPELKAKDYDLVIFGYQPWFLSPSNPANSFLKSEWAGTWQGKPVITVVGAAICGLMHRKK